MIHVIHEVLAPDFVLRNSVYVSLLIGLACPLVGVYLILRRLVFLGVALPQISSCGIAAAFALHAWHRIPHLAENSEQGLAFAGSMVFTLAAILVLSLLERRGRELIEGRVGTAYVLAGAWSILLLVKNPFGEHGLLDRLKGELITVLDSDLAWAAGTFALVLLLLVLFHKEFMLVSFDPDMARTLKKNVLGWDTLLFLLIGVTISMAVLNVGPLVTFGFLILPPLTARVFASTMFQFSVAACVIGVVTAFAGFCLAFKFDLPTGPTDVALLGCVYGVVAGLKRLVRLVRPPRTSGALAP